MDSTSLESKKAMGREEKVMNRCKSSVPQLLQTAISYHAKLKGLFQILPVLPIHLLFHWKVLPEIGQAEENHSKA